MPGFFETIRQKDAEYEARQEQDRANGTGDWNEDFYESERNRSLLDKAIWGYHTPPHPLYGKTAEEKVASLLRWIF